MLKSLALLIPPIRATRDRMRAIVQHAASLEHERATHLAELATLRTQLAHLTQPQTPIPAFQIVQHIHRLWCDAHGVFLSGWIHAGPHPILDIAVSSGPAQVQAERMPPRPDVLKYYPNIPKEGAAAFDAYLQCPPFTPILLHITTAIGTETVPVETRVTPDNTHPDATTSLDAFVASMRERRGRVLELGARPVGSLTSSWRSTFGDDCTFLTNDIHPAPGIDLVADAHSLSTFTGEATLDGIFSVAVLEHLAEPWLAAAEINRALKPGGLTLHVTHQSWPIHETPNDFFRFSDQALKSLFGPAAGFETVEAGMAYPITMYPPNTLRITPAYLTVPEGRGFAQSFILARKTGPVPDPASSRAARLDEISRLYPQRHTPPPHDTAAPTD